MLKQRFQNIKKKDTHKTMVSEKAIMGNQKTG